MPVIAGEDSEFGVRVGAAGEKITKIGVPMATHDADIHRFGQWWRRAVRAGHAIGQRFGLNGRGPIRDCARERRSVLLWGVSLPLLIVGLAPFTAGGSVLLAGGYLLLARESSRYRRAQGTTPPTRGSTPDSRSSASSPKPSDCSNSGGTASPGATGSSSTSE